MENLEQIGKALQTTLGVIVYILLSYALPREVIRKSLRKHYREWVTTGAYWHRNYDKWVVRRRVFYTDEFWGDLQLAVVCGLLLGSGAAFAFLWFTKVEEVPFFFWGTILSTTFLLFVLAQVDRLQFIDAEIELKKLANSAFDPELELKKLLEGDRRWVKKVVERQFSQR